MGFRGGGHGRRLPYGEELLVQSGRSGMKSRDTSLAIAGLFFYFVVSTFCFSQSAPDLDRWLKPQDWKRDSDTPALSLGEKGCFDDQHIFAPHVIFENGEYSMYYCGSQRCVEAGTYKG